MNEHSKTAKRQRPPGSAGLPAQDTNTDTFGDQPAECEPEETPASLGPNERSSPEVSDEKAQVSVEPRNTTTPKVRIIGNNESLEFLGDLARLAEIMGTNDRDITVPSLVRATCISQDLTPEKAINAAIAYCDGIKPRDFLESSLALQMHACETTAMRLLGLANSTLSDERGAMYLSSATKLLRTFTAQVEALNRYRGKVGEQKVVVEHVHVNAGGQAIVGSINRGGEGGR